MEHPGATLLVLLLIAVIFWPHDTDDDQGPGGGLMTPILAHKQ